MCLGVRVEAELKCGPSVEYTFDRDVSLGVGVVAGESKWWLACVAARRLLQAEVHE